MMNHLVFNYLCLTLLMAMPTAFGAFYSKTTPLHRAATEGNLEELKELLKSKTFNINGIDFQGDTPLHCAVKRNHPEIVRELLQYGADVNKESEKDFFSGPFCLSNGTISSEDSHEYTPFYLAIANNYVEVIHELLQHHNVDVFKPLHCRDGKVVITPLQMANFQHPEIVPMIRNYVKHTSMMALATALHAHCGKASPAKILRDKMLIAILDNLMQP